MGKWKYETWWEYLERVLSSGFWSLYCPIVGHVPEQKLSCTICRNCRLVIRNF